MEKFLSRRLAARMMFSILLGLAGNDAAALVGGTEVASDDPIMASTVVVIRLSKDGRSVDRCTGTLLAADLVVTAAHCLYDTADWPLTPMYIYVYFGNFERYAEGFADRRFKAGVAEAVPHPNAIVRQGQVTRFDVGLVRLSTPVPKGFREAEIYDGQVALNHSVVVAGFGAVEWMKLEMKSLILQRYDKARVDAFERETTFIQGPTREGPYKGDSGGPAFVMKNGVPKLWGVYSNFFPNEKGTALSGRAKIEELAYYKDWINRVAQEWGSRFRM